MRHADLTGEQNVLTGLGHGTVGGGNHDDRAVHLSGTGDHVLDVVGVTGAVHVSVVTVVGFVFDVGGGNGDTTFLFFRSLVDFVVRDELTALLHSSDFGDGGSQSGLAVVDVTDSTNVHMRLGTRKFFLTHDGLPSWLQKITDFYGTEPVASQDHPSLAINLAALWHPDTLGTAKWGR